MNNFLKTSGSLWKYYIVEPNATLADSESFKFNVRVTGKISADNNAKDVKIAVPLKYLSNFWRTLEVTLINFEISLILTWSQDCVISSATGETKFVITDTKLYAPAVTLSTQDNAKLLEQLRSSFQRTISWNKYQSKVSTERKNQYLNYLIDPRFHRINRLFVLSFEDDEVRETYRGYFLSKVEIKDYNVKIDG